MSSLGSADALKLKKVSVDFDGAVHFFRLVSNYTFAHLLSDSAKHWQIDEEDYELQDEDGATWPSSGVVVDVLMAEKALDDYAHPAELHVFLKPLNSFSSLSNSYYANPPPSIAGSLASTTSSTTDTAISPPPSESGAIAIPQQVGLTFGRISSSPVHTHQRHPSKSDAVRKMIEENRLPPPLVPANLSSSLSIDSPFSISPTASPLGPQPRFIGLSKSDGSMRSSVSSEFAPVVGASFPSLATHDEVVFTPSPSLHYTYTDESTENHHGLSSTSSGTSEKKPRQPLAPWPSPPATHPLPDATSSTKTDSPTSPSTSPANSAISNKNGSQYAPTSTSAQLLSPTTEMGLNPISPKSPSTSTDDVSPSRSQHIQAPPSIQHQQPLVPQPTHTTVFHVPDPTSIPQMPTQSNASTHSPINLVYPSTTLQPSSQIASSSGSVTDSPTRVPGAAAIRLRKAYDNVTVNEVLTDPRIQLTPTTHKDVTLEWDTPPKTVFIIKKRQEPAITEILQSMACWLQQEKGVKVLIEPSVVHELPSMDLEVFDADASHNDASKYPDLIICLGGDGTVLHANTLFQNSIPPVMAFSLGSLGFLTPFRIRKYKQSISAVLNECKVTLRSRLFCVVVKHGPDGKEFVSKRTVLNEVVVDRGYSPYLSNLECYCDGIPITNIQADGIIISSTTGSTAYSLSAGGSIVHPQMPAILFTPICPHSLSFRPLIFPDSVELKIQVPTDSRSTAWASFDGREQTELSCGEYLIIRISKWPFVWIRESDGYGDWFKSLGDCLHWNDRRKQKSFAPSSSPGPPPAAPNNSLSASVSSGSSSSPSGENSSQQGATPGR